MILTIILIIIGAAILDTLFGNMVFPGKVEVLEDDNSSYYPHIVRKTHRIFLIPVRKYKSDDSKTRVMADTWGPYRKANHFNERDSLYQAKLYSNKLEDETLNHKVVWSSRPEKPKTPTHEEEIYRIGEELRALPKPEQEKLLKRLEL